ncbi:hypothetical protein D0859_02977 [Hortaea werneckii]|uniref:Uncharacterized protein n=1 Tax=Hortaea werneckii TaxID=91943 RepID=A0A3M7J5J4_HORWE|nr:hypothetical protein D0859_02977 [Hortaea werneckii]
MHMRAIQTASRLALQRRGGNVPASTAKISSRGLCHCNVSVPKPPGWQPRKPETAAKPGVRPYASVNEEHPSKISHSCSRKRNMSALKIDQYPRCNLRTT